MNFTWQHPKRTLLKKWELERRAKRSIEEKRLKRKRKRQDRSKK
jgi:TfoX/Sxy family transcriptional regulator of competence genes